MLEYDDDSHTVVFGLWCNVGLSQYMINLIMVIWSYCNYTRLL